MEEQLNLYQKLAKVRAIADAVRKNKKGYNYSYSDITEILAKVTAGMNRYGISLVPNIVPGTTEITQVTNIKTKVDKSGKPYDQTTTEMLVHGDMVFRWVNEENPSEFIDVNWLVVGQQEDPSQAFGSGLTYCTRYFLSEYFQIAQTDTDVDAYRSKQKEAQQAEEKTIAKNIIDDFDGVLKAYLADHQEKRDEVVEFLKRFAKNANYLTITDPKLAAKMVDDFKKTFIGG